MPITLDGSNGITTPMYNGSITANAVTPSVNMKNRIINGAMVIDQRNAGASVTPTSSATAYATDRWALNVSQNSKLTAQQSSSFVGFTNSLLITSLSSYSVTSGDYFMVDQNIEGLNVGDLGWGTANAQPVTLSFKVKSSLTGTFGGVISNSANNRSYPFSYTISSANTETSISITIAGDTSGTWLTTNGVGIRVRFSMGAGSTYTGTAGAWAGATYLAPTGATSVVGTNGATFYITGVQLEVGSTATSFDYRPYQQELALCQRYYIKYAAPTNTGVASSGYGVAINTTLYDTFVSLPVSMRVSASSMSLDVSSMQYYIASSGGTGTGGTYAITYNTNSNVVGIRYTHGSGVFTQGGAVALVGSGTTGYVALSAEL